MENVVSNDDSDRDNGDAYQNSNSVVRAVLNRCRQLLILMCKSSCPEVYYKIRVLKNFAKFKGKHLCQSLFF